MKMSQVKCVFAGDSTVGKKCVLFTYLDKTFPNENKPFIFDTETVTLLVDEEPVNLCLHCVTDGHEYYERLRPLTYVDANVFLICFSLVCPESFGNVRYKWYPEIKRYSRGIPIVLVGTKKDLREDATVKVVSRSQGLEMSEEMGSVRYLECSAFTGEGLDGVFDEGVRAGLEQCRQKEKPIRKCSIL